MNELTIRTADLPEFANKTLNSATRKIAAIGERIAKNLYNVAAILNDVNEKKAYEEDGFKTCAEYAQKTFGFKKSMAYSLLKIGAEYTAENHESNLPHEEGHDFTVSQIEKCLPLKDHGKVVELVEGEVITPDMSCKEIEKTVKGIMNPPQETTEEDQETTEEAPEQFSMEGAEKDVDMYCEHIKAIFEEARNNGYTGSQLSPLTAKLRAMLEDLHNITK